jgi:hypothetical protein
MAAGPAAVCDQRAAKGVILLSGGSAPGRGAAPAVGGVLARPAETG